MGLAVVSPGAAGSDPPATTRSRGSNATSATLDRLASNAAWASTHVGLSIPEVRSQHKRNAHS